MSEAEPPGGISGKEILDKGENEAEAAEGDTAAPGLVVRSLGQGRREEKQHNGGR